MNWAIGTTTRALLLAVGMASAASALAVPITDDFDDAKKIEKGKFVSIQHNINNRGYDKNTEIVTSASLVITLSDEWGGGETYKITIDGSPDFISSDDIIGSKSLHFNLDAASIAALAKTGNLGVKIYATDCTGSECKDHVFKFESSELIAQVTRLAPQPPTGSVPEPGTLSLLGLGLAGVAALRRRAKREEAARPSQG